ncbi:hypothetical protein [Neobacillus massiliamazoniensis]|uniref:hypothetical protein n=1 Tax=Neobacillus massiliamazoniensis TaxID=1499688 RepID=UPI00159ECDBE|nr:hypothetical protein [Neobacillus massiliamazoniensis]
MDTNQHVGIAARLMKNHLTMHGKSLSVNGSRKTKRGLSSNGGTDLLKRKN